MTTGVSAARRARVNINSSTICWSMVKLDVIREIVENTEEHMCGDLDPAIENVTKGRKLISIQMAMNITQPILDVVLPLLGITDLGGNAYELGKTDDVTSFGLIIDLVGAIHNVTDCYTASFGFTGQKGDRPCRLIWNVIGTDETEAGTFTEAMIDWAKPFSFTDTDCTISGASVDTSRPIDRFQIFCDNQLVSEHNNSVTLTDATPGDRRSIFATSVPYAGVHDDLHWSIIDDDSGKQAVIVLNNTVKTVTFTMPRGLGRGEVGDITRKGGQVRTPVKFQLYKYDNSGTRVSPLGIAITNS